VRPGTCPVSFLVILAPVGHVIIGILKLVSIHQGISSLAIITRPIIVSDRFLMLAVFHMCNPIGDNASSDP